MIYITSKNMYGVIQLYSLIDIIFLQNDLKKVLLILKNIILFLINTFIIVAYMYKFVKYRFVTIKIIVNLVHKLSNL